MSQKVQYVVVLGNPFFKGFNLFGPFNDRSEAEQWLSKNNIPSVFDIVPVYMDADKYGW